SDSAAVYIGLELKGYLINDGYADLVQHADKKELAILGKTATGKELSNSLMAGSLPKTTLPTNAKTTSWNEFSSSMASGIICLATNQKFNFLSGEDSLKLKELMNLCTNLSNKVLELKSKVLDIKSTYKAKIEKLESRVERLKEENMVLKELKGVHSTVDSNEPVMEKEESSKQGRK
nr:hypothetical protein [Tanacetum cinerariifolium]